MERGVLRPGAKVRSRLSREGLRVGFRVGQEFSFWASLGHDELSVRVADIQRLGAHELECDVRLRAILGARPSLSKRVNERTSE